MGIRLLRPMTITKKVNCLNWKKKSESDVQKMVQSFKVHVHVFLNPFDPLGSR